MRGNLKALAYNGDMDKDIGVEGGYNEPEKI